MSTGDVPESEQAEEIKNLLKKIGTLQGRIYQYEQMRISTEKMKAQRDAGEYERIKEENNRLHSAYENL